MSDRIERHSIKSVCNNHTSATRGNLGVRRSSWETIDDGARQQNIGVSYGASVISRGSQWDKKQYEMPWVSAYNTWHRFLLRGLLISRQCCAFVKVA